jgi:hypothetical protein
MRSERKFLWDTKFHHNIYVKNTYGQFWEMIMSQLDTGETIHLEFSLTSLFHDDA